MELIVNGNDIIDLPEKVKATVDYELFSSDGENLVSILTGLDIPATEKNLEIINPLVNGRSYDVELTSPFGNSFIGTLDVDAQTFNRVDEQIETTIIEKLKDVFRNMDSRLSGI